MRQAVCFCNGRQVPFSFFDGIVIVNSLRINFTFHQEKSFLRRKVWDISA